MDLCLKHRQTWLTMEKRTGMNFSRSPNPRKSNTWKKLDTGTPKVLISRRYVVAVWSNILAHRENKRPFFK